MPECFEGGYGWNQAKYTHVHYWNVKTLTCAVFMLLCQSLPVGRRPGIWGPLSRKWTPQTLSLISVSLLRLWLLTSTSLHLMSLTLRSAGAHLCYTLPRVEVGFTASSLMCLSKGQSAECKAFCKISVQYAPLPRRFTHPQCVLISGTFPRQARACQRPHSF